MAKWEDSRDNNSISCFFIIGNYSVYKGGKGTMPLEVCDCKINKYFANIIILSVQNLKKMRFHAIYIQKDDAYLEKNCLFCHRNT